jgi:hypothetical protein
MLLVIPLLLEFNGVPPSFGQLLAFVLEFFRLFSRGRHLPLWTVVSDRRRNIGMETCWYE